MFSSGYEEPIFSLVLDLSVVQDFAATRLTDTKNRENQIFKAQFNSFICLKVRSADKILLGFDVNSVKNKASCISLMFQQF